MKVLEDAVTLALVVSVQLGVPVTVLFVIGYLRYRCDPSGREARQGRPVAGIAIAQDARARPAFGTNRPCWEVKQCSPEESRDCPARRRSQMPCWQATRTPYGHLRARCVNCDRFLAPPSPGWGR